jgi:glycosyltransferase involved in cell wall biosynthesis
MAANEIAFSIIIPIYNAMRYLERCLHSVITAAEAHGGTEIILVDNGSRDGSYEFLQTNYGRVARVLQITGVKVGGVRNFGAREANGKYLAFVDSDCVLPRDYFLNAAVVLRSVACNVTGSSYHLPDPPHWIEGTWRGVNKDYIDRYVKFLPSGNLVVEKSAFDAVGGFSEALSAGEDADLGGRLLQAGYLIFECHRVFAIHLGNPKSLREFFRKQVWHGMGAFGVSEDGTLDKTLLMTVMHGLFLVAAVIVIFLPLSLLAKLLTAAVLLWLAPVITVLYRSLVNRRVFRPLRASLLYWVYLTARSYSLLKLAGTRLNT